MSNLEAVLSNEVDQLKKSLRTNSTITIILAVAVFALIAILCSEKKRMCLQSFINRNRKVFKMLKNIVIKKYGDSRIEVKNRDGGRQIHSNVTSASHLWRSSTAFEMWESELSIYDEPHSSGSTPPTLTHIRNDFVIFRFRRKES